MTYAGDLDEDQEPWDDDFYDPDDRYEPDPSDWEEQRAHWEYEDHCDKVHKGGDCNCRPPLRERITTWLRDCKKHVAIWRRWRPYDDEPPF